MCTAGRGCRPCACTRNAHWHRPCFARRVTRLELLHRTGAFLLGRNIYLNNTPPWAPAIRSPRISRCSQSSPTRTRRLTTASGTTAPTSISAATCPSEHEERGRTGSSHRHVSLARMHDRRIGAGRWAPSGPTFRTRTGTASPSSTPQRERGHRDDRSRQASARDETRSRRLAAVRRRERSAEVPADDAGRGVREARARPESRWSRGRRYGDAQSRSGCCRPGSDPEQFAISADGRRLFVANEDAAQLSVIDVGERRR